jgi:putative ABC transport system ATP-binding protein
MSETTILEIRDVVKRRFKVDGSAHDVLDGVDLDIRPGEIVALIGPSGMGKSTFLRLLNRLEEVDAGRISFLGQPFGQINPLKLRRQIGLVTQKPFMFPGTVRDNLMIALRDRGETPPSSQKLEALLKTCAVDADWLDQPARRLSVGQQQRVSIARVLLNHPHLLLLDEPTSSLDPETAEDVLSRLIAHVADNESCLLLVTHDHQLAKRHAGRIIELRDGKLNEGHREDAHAEN